MDKSEKKTSWVTILRVASLLARRQITRGNIWINVLIVFIMTLTFLSLVVISGILVGLLEGSFQANRAQYTGDVFIDTLSSESSIQTTSQITSILDNLDEVEGYTVRFKTGSTVEANYQTRRNFEDLPNSVGISLVGIDPTIENKITNLSSNLIEGEMLDPKQSGYIMIGSTLLKQYSNFSDLFEPLEDVFPGSRVKVSVTGTEIGFDGDLSGGDTQGSNTQEFIVKGIIKSKVDEVSISAYVTEADYRRLTGKTSLQAQEIAIIRSDDVTDEGLKNILLSYGIEDFARVRTAEEAIPKFLDDIQVTFSLLGSAIGSIGLVVSAISIFIVIYINALTRRKFIGILKGIGISGRAIELAYVMQSIFYVIAGSIIGAILVYFVLIPVIDANPIDFPFSDGILVAEPIPTLSKFLTLFVVTTLAGFIPAWLIVRRNTLDSILQR